MCTDTGVKGRGPSELSSGYTWPCVIAMDWRPLPCYFLSVNRDSECDSSADISS